MPNARAHDPSPLDACGRKQAANAIAGKNGATPRGFTRPLRCTWATERRTPVGAPGAPGAAPATPAPAAPPAVPAYPGYGAPQYAAPYPGYPPPAPGYHMPYPAPYPGPAYPAPYPAPGYPPPNMPPPHGYPPPPVFPGANGDRDNRREEDDSGKYGKMERESRGGSRGGHPYAR